MGFLEVVTKFGGFMEFSLERWEEGDRIFLRGTYKFIVVFALVVLPIGGFTLADYLMLPKSVEVRDLNKDDLPDVIVKSRLSTAIYLGRKDGTYQNVYDIYKRYNQGIEQVRASQDSLDAELKAIQDAAKHK